MTKRRKHSGISLMQAVLFVFLLIYSISLFVPIIFGINTSLKNVMDFGAPGNNVLGLPNKLFWKFDRDYPNNMFANFLSSVKYFNFTVTANYEEGIFIKNQVDAKTDINIWIALKNTLLHAGGCALIQSFTCLLMAYMCAMYKNRASRIIYSIVILVIAIPIVGTTPAQINLMRNLRLFDNFAGDWISCASFTGMYFLIYYSAFKGMSGSFGEAAEIDGASQLGIFARIYLPLAKGIFLTVALLLFVNYWNDYMTPMIFLPTKTTLAYGIYHLTERLTGTKMNQVPRKVAVLIMFAIPIIILFAVFSDKFMKNFTMGGVKE